MSGRFGRAEGTRKFKRKMRKLLDKPKISIRGIKAEMKRRVEDALKKAKEERRIKEAEAAQMSKVTDTEEKEDGSAAAK